MTRVSVDTDLVAVMLCEFSQSEDYAARNAAAHLTAGLAGIFREDPSFNYRKFVNTAIPKKRPRRKKTLNKTNPGKVTL